MVVTRRQWFIFALIFLIWIASAFLWGSGAGWEIEALDSCQDIRPRGC